jgi:hypothetical protein
MPANASMMAASAAFEAEIMASRRTSCNAAIGRERNRAFRSAYDGPKHPHIARHRDLELSLMIAWSDLAQPPRDTGKIPYLGMLRQANCRMGAFQRSRFPAARAVAVNRLFFLDDFGED